MLGKLVKFVVGSRNERLIKKKRKLVKAVNKLAEEYAQLTDEELQAKTKEFRSVEKTEVIFFCCRSINQKLCIIMDRQIKQLRNILTFIYKSVRMKQCQIK